MRTCPEGIALIKEFEGCRLTAYQDSIGIWTIGWGCTHDSIQPGETITQEQADNQLMEDILCIEEELEKWLKTLLNNYQFSAIVSFCFNVGYGEKGVKDGFFTLKSGDKSTLLKLIESRNFDRAADEFPKWCKVGGVPSKGILRRRLSEMDLFLKENK